jgi:NADH dehydrogenase
MNHKPRVIIIGAGFGGLYAARTLEKQKAIDVLLIDRNNFHAFTPLLYQVATSALEPGEIAYPVRGIFRKQTNIRFLMGEVEMIDTSRKAVLVRTDGQYREEKYDYLIVAAGSVSNYFGMDYIPAFDLKTVSDAVGLRNHILQNFERAAWLDDDPARAEALTTMVVVGGGPTGLETAGALHELYNHVLQKEYQTHPHMHARVILVEATDRLLRPYPERLQESARKQLESLGVEVIFNNPISNATEEQITLEDGTIIPTHTVIWAAGVQASPVAEMLGVPLVHSGRVPVLPTVEAAGLQDVYVVGDMAYFEDDKGAPYPMLIPVAKQQGILAARNITRREQGKQQQVFRYIDRGMMATIGRNRAVAWIYYKIQLSGFLAWLAWLGLHLVTLMGFRNRLNVFINWVWNYFTYDRSIRIILRHQSKEGEQALE